MRALRDWLGLYFPILMDAGREVMDAGREVAERYRAARFLESLLVDRDGAVIERFIGRIARLLRESVEIATLPGGKWGGMCVESG